MPHPDCVILWLPPDDEHALALSLGLVAFDPDTLRARAEAVQLDVAERLPGTQVIIKRWPVAEVVATLARLGLANTPDGLAAAFAVMADE